MIHDPFFIHDPEVEIFLQFQRDAEKYLPPPDAEPNEDLPASIHTHARNLPFRQWLMGLFSFLFLGGTCRQIPFAVSLR